MWRRRCSGHAKGVVVVVGGGGEGSRANLAGGGWEEEDDEGGHEELADHLDELKVPELRLVALEEKPDALHHLLLHRHRRVLLLLLRARFCLRSLVWWLLL
eukprot:1519795-Rhodomonas_salina.1